MTWLDDHEDDIIYGHLRGDEGEDEDDGQGAHQPSCNRCFATDVRWRQQGGKWVLFSLEPGKLHICPIPDEFEAVPE